MHLKVINFRGYKFSRIFIFADDCHFTFNFAGLNFRGFSRIAAIFNSSRDLIFSDFADRGYKFRNQEEVNGTRLYHIKNLSFLKNFAGLYFRGSPKFE